MKMFSFVLVFFCCISILKTQNFYESQVIDYNNVWNVIQDGVEIGNYYVLSGTYGSPIIPDSGQIVRINKANGEVDFFSHLNYYSSKFINIEKRMTNDEETVIVNGIFRNSTENSDSTEIFLSELTTDSFSIIKHQTYGIFGNGDYPLRMIKTSDGGVAVIGYTFSFGTPWNDQSMFLLKCDSLLNQEFFKLYTHTFQDGHYANGIVETPDGGFLIVGNKNKSNGRSDGLILRVNSFGTVISWKEFPSTTEFRNNYLVDVILKEDGNYLVVGQRVYEAIGIPTDNRYWVMEINENDEVLNSYEYFSYRGAAWFSINPSSDGNFILGGYQRYNPQLINGVYQTPQLGSVSKINPTGELIWHRQYMNNPNELHYDLFYNTIPTTDNGILAVGTTWGDTLTRQDVWVLKLDSLGCLEEGCDPIINSVEEEIFEEVLVEVFPNPFEERVTFRWKHSKIKPRAIRVFDLLGKEVWYKKVTQNSVVWNTHHLQKGSYYYIIYDENETLIHRDKLIKN